MPSAYRVAPLFLIRVAGVPFDAVERLATPNVCDLVRQSLVSNSKEPLGAILEGELENSRRSLLEWARTVLPSYLIFSTQEIRERAASLVESRSDLVPRRNSRARERERHLVLYLQRLAAKNDTFSEFGPSGWGRIISDLDAIEINIKPGIAARDAFLERWTAHAIAAAMNADPAIFPELAPRLNPNGSIHEDKFVILESGKTIELEPAQVELIRRCDGERPVHALEAPVDAIRKLVKLEVLRCEMEVPAMEPYAFNTLCDDVAGWRHTETREKWLRLLQPLRELQQNFARAATLADRQQVLNDVTSRLEQLGVSSKSGQRFLYAATNPIAEECFRECGFSIGERLIDHVPHDAAPWIDLWRDSYAFVASRVAGGLRQILEISAPEKRVMTLPAFLKACESAKLRLTGPGLVALAHIAFQEVKAAFREQLQPHVSAEEYELTVEDCHIVRQRFEYDKFDEYSYPSADLQLAAESIEAVSAGNYQWILSELHPPVAMLHHCMYWACPDKQALSAALMQTIGNKPNFHFGFFAADFTAHTTVRIFDVLPGFSNYVAPERANPKWRTTAPGDAEVYIQEESGDVCVRETQSGEHLGSFARAWLIPLGFHPFQFSLGPHTPRFRCGRVIVQRRSWAIAEEELGSGKYTGISPDLVLATERLRAEKSWPRYIYIRPTEQALRRSGAEGRDKDTKPVFVDLESYLSLEIFHRWLSKAGELEVTEMLPAPDQLLWREADGRRTFEMRTQIVPRQ